MNEALFAEPTASQPLPHSIEAEQAVLGGLMLKNDAFDAAATVLSDTDFYSQDHQLIFNAMARLAEERVSPLIPSLSVNLYKTVMS